MKYSIATIILMALIAVIGLVFKAPNYNAYVRQYYPQKMAVSEAKGDSSKFHKVMDSIKTEYKRDLVK